MKSPKINREALAKSIIVMVGIIVIIVMLEWSDWFWILAVIGWAVYWNVDEPKD